MTPEKPHLERRRTNATDIALGEVSERLDTLQNTFTAIEQDVREDLNNLVSSIQGVIVRMEERDRRANEIMLDNKSAFERLGETIKGHDTRLINLEVKVSRVDSLERLLYALFAGIGALFVWMLQKLLT